MTDEQNAVPASTAADRRRRVRGVRGEKTGAAHGGDEATRGESVTLFQVKELTRCLAAVRQSRRDAVRGITQTRVKHLGMRGVKRRNRVEEGERKKVGEDGMGRRWRGGVGVGRSLTGRETAEGLHCLCESTFKHV